MPASETSISEDFTLTPSTLKWLSTEYPQLDPDKRITRFKAADYVGQRRNMLTILSPAERWKTSAGAMAQCACGMVIHMAVADWYSGRKKSCGCSRAKLAALSLRKHPKDVLPTYRAWHRMKIRCKNDPGSPNQKYYYERGITVCDRWKSFDNFLTDMGKKPAGRSLDRIEGSKGYEPGNCRWATSKEQSTNRPGFVVLVEYNGEKRTMAEWDGVLGFKSGLVKSRISQGWSHELALTTPVRLSPRWHNEKH